MILDGQLKVRERNRDKASDDEQQTEG